MKNFNQRTYLKTIFGLWSVQAFVSMLWLLLIPTDSNNGFTTPRLILLGISFLLLITSSILYFYNNLLLRDLFDIKVHQNVWDVIYIFLWLILLISPITIIILYALQSGNQFVAYAQRLTPFAIWFFLSALELLIFIIFSRYENAKETISALKLVHKKIIVTFLAFIPIVLIVAITKIGITSGLNVGPPAIPLLEWQIILAVVIAMFFWVYRKHTNLDRWLPFIIYAFTLILWLSQPINTAFTATPPRAPNFEIYPFSDPQIYTQYSQSALVGNGFLYPDVPSRPLYIAFLTWAHLLGGQNYNHVVIIQSLLLALFPVVLYLLGKEFGSRSLGIILAILIAFRDVNANIAVPIASNVSYSKLFLSEMPLALCISLFTLLVLRWLRNNQQSTLMPLLIGSILGGATLIRTQSIALIFVIIFFAFISVTNRKQFFKSVFLLSLSLLITLSPHLTRNYIATGGITLDNTISQIMTMAMRWAEDVPAETFTKQKDESEADFSNRMTQVVIESFKRKPESIIQTAANHFMNSEIVSLMILPTRNEIYSLQELLIPQRMFWSTLKTNQLSIFSFYVFLCGLGIALAFQRHKWLGLFPLALGFIYNAWTALFLSSGERFVLPLDWSILLYQIFGLIGLGALILSFTRYANQNASFWTLQLGTAQKVFQYAESSSRQKIIFTSIAILLLSIFTPFTEFIFPKKYELPTVQAVTQMTEIIPKDSELIIYGRALYPRYYESGEGEPETAKLGYAESEIPRLVFLVVGTQNALVIFELATAPEFFPHTADVYLIGTWSEGYFSPRVAYVSKDGKTAIYQIP
jgi:hypothetical protein